ncbi:hypothetical protein KR054_008751 [Drosophila jambulina]|nr:hypothetical protein KR054_008751 [Drosophila jambulina]
MKKTYFFDAILVTSSLPEPEFAADTLRADGGRVYSIRLFDDFEDLPLDRLFVEQFPEGPALTRFTASPCELIGSLSTRGVCVGLTENEERIADGIFMLGPTILRQLTDPTFSVTQSVMVELVKGKKSICVVELIVKISSSDPDINQMLVPFGTYDVCRPMEREISKRDIIFTLGRSGKCGTSTCITDERLMSHAGAPNPCPHAPTEDAEARGGASARCGCYAPGLDAPNAKEEAKKKEREALKKLVEELGLDQVKVPEPPRAFKQSRRWHRSTTSSTPDSTSSCNPYDFMPESPPKKRKALSLTASMEQQARHRILGPCPVAQPDLKSEPYKPPQLCQLCKSDISWLPKISACPYCGYKTFEDIPPSEGSYDLTATAQQLLRDCLRKEVCERDSSTNGVDRNEGMGMGDGNSPQDDPNVPKRCLCVSGQPCTRCRIRKLCENFVKDSEVKQTQAPSQVPKVSKAKSQPVQGKEPNMSQRRSELVSIFTEMRDMYARGKGADEADAKAEQLRKECDAVCRSTKTSKARRKEKRALEKALKEIDKAYPSPPKKRVKKRVQRPKSKCYTFIKLPKRPTDPRIGHTACLSDGACSGYCKVPCHMGWMWTKSEMARYKSWRPGAIAKPIREMMAYFLRDYPADNICLSRYHYLRRKCRKEKTEEEPLVQHPTLQISRKGDEYIITLRPLKDPKSLALSPNPYADMKPVVFRITKDPMAVALRELREYLRDKGFAPCTCGRTLAHCFCRSHIDKERIQYEVDQRCLRRGWNINSETFMYSPDDDDDDSDREYEFGVTPPAGVIKPERQPRPDRTNAETQYMETDWAAPSMYPHPASMLAQYGACVMGERKKEFAWLYGKGNIHGAPKKPVMRNKPKKKPKKKLPFRSAGGYDDPRRFDPAPLNRPWSSNAPGRVR